MESVAGAGVVVTGAGSGVGAALARRFVAEGGRVIVNDIDAVAAAAVATACGATAVPGDAATEDGVAALVGVARDVLGEIDLFCANAGVARRGDEQASEADWAASWQVKVMADVRAARVLLPAWVGGGSGHLISAVSVGWLLPMHGESACWVTYHV